jgi:transcriptional regulator with XRE-family HTH domain
MVKKTSRRTKRGVKPKPTAQDVEVGKRVRAFRLERGMSQRVLGQSLGITFQQIQKYEKGTNRVAAGRLQAMSEVFQVPISAFFSEKKRSSTQTLFELAYSRGAMSLLRAYQSMADPKLKRHLVTLATTMAAQANEG